jgi:tetratricopeptide (TPR) repeat protein
MQRGAYAAALVRSIALLALLAGACRSGAHPAQSAGPAARTRALLAEARKAERARQYDRARELYLRAAREAPDRRSQAIAWRELGSALIFWGELDEAAKALGKVVELEPGAVSAWHDLGIVRARLGDAAGAEKAFRRAIQLAPEEPRPRVALAALLVRQRRWDAALEEYRALEQLDLPERTRSAVGRAIELIEAERRRRAPR